MNDFKNDLNNAMEQLSAERDVVSSAKIRAAAERPERKISAKRIFGTAAAVCGVLICGVTAAAATGLIDFDAVFGDRITVKDSELAGSLVGTVKNFKYKVSDSDYKIDIKGVTGDDKSVVAVAEISRVDGTPVTDYFANPVSSDENQLLPLWGRAEVSRVSSYSYSIDHRINEAGNIVIFVDLDSTESIDGKKMTFKGENFYPAGDYIAFEYNNNENEDTFTEYTQYGENSETASGNDAPAYISSILAIDLDWEFSFTYKASDKSHEVKSLNAPESSFTLNMRVHTFEPAEDRFYEITAQPSYIEAGSTGGRIDYVYKDTGYVGNRAYVTDIREENEVYVIMSSGERVKAYFDGGYEHPNGNICTCSYEITYWDENAHQIFINADDITAISINGTVYKLN